MLERDEQGRRDEQDSALLLRSAMVGREACIFCAVCTVCLALLPPAQSLVPIKAPSPGRTAGAPSLRRGEQALLGSKKIQEMGLSPTSLTGSLGCSRPLSHPLSLSLSSPFPSLPLERIVGAPFLQSTSHFLPPSFASWCCPVSAADSSALIRSL
jgi:hypothetical protein